MTVGGTIGEDFVDNLFCAGKEKEYTPYFHIEDFTQIS
jgi:hypothetical protein